MHEDKLRDDTATTFVWLLEGRNRPADASREIGEARPKASVTSGTMTGHIDHEALAAFSADLLAGPTREDVSTHITTCVECRGLVEEYREIVGTLRVWRQAPADAAEAGTRPLVQRIRLQRLLGELVSDPSARHQAAQNPERLLTTHGITPTPQLLAAFRELDVSHLERFSGQLDERIAKLLFRLID